MNLELFKTKVYSLIEEYNENAETLTDDEDLSTKMNHVINQIQNELARIKKIPAVKMMAVEKDQEISLKDIDTNIYQLNIIRNVDADIIGDNIIFNEDGNARIYYYVYPAQIDGDTEDDFIFDLSTDVMEIAVYGVAGDLLKSDVSSQYGAVYSARYREMLQQLDPRYNVNSVYISGGVE
jgi:hypothetical protein